MDAFKPVYNSVENTETVNIHTLKEFQGELKSLSKENYHRLKRQILKHGISSPIHVWDSDGLYTLDGHQRIRTLKAMAAEGYVIPDVPIVRIRAPNRQAAKQIVLGLASQYGKVESEGLYEFLHEAELQWTDAKDLLSFPEIDFDKFEAEFGEDTTKEGLTDDDAIPESDIPARVKLGDVWCLGNHRLMCGDSTDLAAVEKLMNGAKADMVFTDPPYSIQTEGGCKGELGKSLQKQGESIEFIADFNPANFLAVLPGVFEKNKMNAYVFCNKELLPDYLNWARTSKFSFNVLIWKKPNAIPIGDSHRPDIEYMLLFRKSAIWNNGLGGVNYSRCLDYGRETGLHPTMKPVGLIENEMKISSNVGSPILDLFGGSGSTLIACEKTKRKCFMMELDPHYCDVILKRWEDFTGLKATKDEIIVRKADAKSDSKDKRR